MRLREDYKEDWTGNAVREALFNAGIPSPNKRLIDALAPVITKTGKGDTFRRWKHSTAEMQLILREMRPLFQQVETFKDGSDPMLLQALLEEVSDSFYRKLSELEARKSTTSNQK